MSDQDPTPKGTSSGSQPDEPAKPPQQASEPSRRGVLGSMVVAGSAAYAGGLGVVGYGFLAGERGKGQSTGERWVRLVKLSALPADEPQRFKVQGDVRDAFTITKAMTLGSVWLRKTGEQVVAMSAECPHLGCAIDLAGDAKSFSCPCHASRFALAGAAESGPSPRGMDVLPTRVVDGWVEVDFKRFRQGLSDQVAL